MFKLTIQKPEEWGLGLLGLDRFKFYLEGQHQQWSREAVTTVLVHREQTLMPKFIELAFWIKEQLVSAISDDRWKCLGASNPVRACVMRMV